MEIQDSGQAACTACAKALGQDQAWRVAGAVRRGPVGGAVMEGREEGGEAQEAPGELVGVCFLLSRVMGSCGEGRGQRRAAARPLTPRAVVQMTCSVGSSEPVSMIPGLHQPWAAANNLGKGATHIRTPVSIDLFPGSVF